MCYFRDGNLLRECLTLTDLHNVTSETHACRANLKERKNLRRLRLWGYYEADHGNNIEAVLEGLRPHPNLRDLEIKCCKDSKLPSWIEDSSRLPNLVRLILHSGIYQQLAGFGVFPSLKHLLLLNMNMIKLECIGNEFYYSAGSSSTAAGGGEESNRISEAAAATTTISFPSLKRLILINMVSLQEWVVPPLSTTNCFPSLEKIIICNCPLLTTITPTTTIFPSHKVLYLEEVDGRATKPLFMNNLNSLTFLTLYGILNLISLPHQGLMENNTTLLALSIEDCRHFKGFLLPNKDEDKEEEYQDDDDQGGGRRRTTTANITSL